MTALSSNWIVYQGFCAALGRRVLSWRAKERCESGRIGLTANAESVGRAERCKLGKLTKSQFRRPLWVSEALSPVVASDHHFDSAVESALNG